MYIAGEKMKSYNISLQLKRPIICLFQVVPFSYESPCGGAEKIAVEVVRALGETYSVVVFEPFSNQPDGLKQYGGNVFSCPSYHLTEEIMNRGVIKPVFTEWARALLDDAELLISIERFVSCPGIKKQMVSLGGVYYPHCQDIMQHSEYDYLVVPSDFVRDQAMQLGVCVEKIHVIQNGIDTSVFHLPDDTVGKEIDFLIASRPGWEKGYKEAVDMIAYFNSKCDQDFALTVCLEQNSSFGTELSLYAHERKLRLCFIGWHEHVAMPALFGRTSCVLSIGTAPEGFGLSVIEAVACGACVISRKIGFVSSVLPYDHGIVYIEDFDLDSPRDCHELILQTRRPEAAHKGSGYIETHYQMADMLSRYKNLIAHLVFS